MLRLPFPWPAGPRLPAYRWRWQIHLEGEPHHRSSDLLGKYADHRGAIVKATELAFRPSDLTVGITPRKWNVGKSFLQA